MGIDVMGAFQRFNGEHWVTVDCDQRCYPVLEEDDRRIYCDGQRGLLRFWLGWGDGGWYSRNYGITPILSSARGLPEDLNDEDVTIGTRLPSWLRGEEILAALPLLGKQTHTVATELAELLWTTGGTLKDWEAAPGIFKDLFPAPSLAAVPVRHEDATEASTGTTLVDGLWDFSRTIADFTDEVLRLSKLHGDIRFVYGFE